MSCGGDGRDGVGVEELKEGKRKYGVCRLCVDVVRRRRRPRATIKNVDGWTNE